MQSPPIPARTLSHHSGLHITLLLIVALLAAEAIAIDHAVEHGFGDNDEICSLCDKADGFQYPLGESGLPFFEPLPIGNRLHLDTYHPYGGSLNGYYPRGPPLHPYF